MRKSAYVSSQKKEGKKRETAAMRDSTACGTGLAGFLLGSPFGRLRNARCATLRWRLSRRSRPLGFESLLLHTQTKKTHRKDGPFSLVDYDLFEPLRGKCSFSLRELNFHCLVHKKTSYIESYNSFGDILPCNSNEISSVKFPVLRIISAACKISLIATE